MNKPFAVLKREFTGEIINAINTSPIDMDIKSMILKQICHEVSKVAERDAEKQIERWEESQKEESQGEIKEVST